MMHYFLIHFLPTAVCVLISFLLAGVSIGCSKRFMKRRFDRRFGRFYSDKHRTESLMQMRRRLNVYMIADSRPEKELV